MQSEIAPAWLTDEFRLTRKFRETSQIVCIF